MSFAAEISHLSKTYGGAFGQKSVTALEDFSLRVEPGEVFGLLGPNGAGKTTLVKVLLGIVRPTAGTASLFGTPVTVPAGRARVGFLPENHRFPDFLTARQMLDLYGRLGGIARPDRQRRIPELLERVRMAEWADTRIKKFSKGMMQRVGLAQALLGAPDLLFLDEPTDGVDPIGRREIRDLLVWLRDEGVTVFLNSHLLSEVEQVCTRVAILNEGHLVRTGTIAELTAVERRYELHATALPPATADALGDVLSPLAAEGRAALPDGLRRFRLTVPDRAHLNAVLDRLRTDGVELDAVTPARRTLEDYFIEVIEDERREP